MEKNKQIRKVASCIKTLLENEGVSVKVKKVVELIQDKDLNNIEALKEVVANDMRATPAAPSSARKNRIETFMVSNWDSIKDNAEVKDALLNAYCMGRISKAKREEMKRELLNKCGDAVVVPEVIIPPEVEVEMRNEVVDVIVNDSNKKYDF